MNPVAGDLKRLDLTFLCDGSVLANGYAMLPSGMDLDCVQNRRSTRLRLSLPADGPAGQKQCWSLTFIPAADEPFIQVVERSTAVLSPWTLQVPGDSVHTHRQLIAVTAEAESVFRFGAFTQHGQLFDLKDWFAVARGLACVVVAGLRPGTWSHSPRTVVHGQCQREGVLLTLPLEGMAERPLRRTYLIATGRTDEVLTPETGSPEAGTNQEAHAGWAPRRIARYGFARPERIASYVRQVAHMSPRAKPPCAFGEAALTRALQRMSSDPGWANGHPFWQGDDQTAWTWASEKLKRYRAALESKAYLHPIGNPVDARNLAPAVATIHLLDCTGRLSRDRRAAAAEDAAVLAELLIRRDFYPHHLATRPPEWPPLEGSLYRGMLNQNFNTDRYAFVGLCGCVLPTHPHARRWRQHFVEQFHEQMHAFVHPGGAWEESHTYANHVKLVLLPTLIAMRHAPEPIDLTRDEAFRAFARFFVQLFSPADAILHGRRGIPAIGDHGYGKHGDYGFLFGWLAEAIPELADEFCWAWQGTGSDWGEGSPQINTYSPLLSAARPSSSQPMPPLAAVKHLPGYGALARRRADTDAESLLVVRCGRTWGHYHPDQGSFWWWVNGQLIACDADLGEGPIKFQHFAHNVLGYPARLPAQFLDYEPYQVEEMPDSETGTVNFCCRIPIGKWHVGHQKVESISLDHRPENTRTLIWTVDGTLEVTDAPVRSPGGRVLWSLNVPTLSEPRRIDARTVAFPLDRQRQLLIDLADNPMEVRLEKSITTWAVHIIYAEAILTHRLRVK